MSTSSQNEPGKNPKSDKIEQIQIFAHRFKTKQSRDENGDIFAEVKQFLTLHAHPDTQLEQKLATDNMTEFVLPPQSLSYPAMQLLAALMEAEGYTNDKVHTVAYMMPSRKETQEIAENGAAGKITSHPGALYLYKKLDAFPAHQLLQTLEQAKRTLQEQLTIGNDGTFIFNADPENKFALDYILRAALPIRPYPVLPGTHADYQDPLYLKYQLPGDREFRNYEGPISGAVSYERTQEIIDFAEQQGDYLTRSDVGRASFISARIEDKEAQEQLVKKLGLDVQQGFGSPGA